MKFTALVQPKETFCKMVGLKGAQPSILIDDAPVWFVYTVEPQYNANHYKTSQLNKPLKACKMAMNILNRP